jgi:hypothetical protein
MLDTYDGNNQLLMMFIYLNKPFLGSYFFSLCPIILTDGDMVG